MSAKGIELRYRSEQGNVSLEIFMERIFEMKKNNDWSKRVYKEPFSEKTKSFYFFENSLLKFRSILHSSTEAIERSGDSLVEIASSLEKSVIDQIGSLPEVPEGYCLTSSPEIDFKEAEDGSALLTAEPEIITLLIKGFEREGRNQPNLVYDLRNIIVVASWACFEGFVQEILSEIFHANPDLVSSEKLIKQSDIVRERDSVMDYLIEEEISDIGRKNLSDLNLYLKNKIKYEISNRHLEKMQEIYQIRNIVAHTAGRVRDSQIRKMPDQVKVEGRHIKIENDYVLGVMHCLEECSIKIDNACIKKYGLDCINWKVSNA